MSVVALVARQGRYFYWARGLREVHECLSHRVIFSMLGEF